MIIKQLFDHTSYTYSYIIGDENTREALIIDPVLERSDQYIQLLSELNFKLTLAIDTHVHADHITALGKLREITNCETMVGVEGEVHCASDCFKDGDCLKVGGLELSCMHTPGHTADSYCFYLNAGTQGYLFTGDTILIRGTGRTDFQNGDPNKLYDNLQRLLELPDNTVVYPGHDYNGFTASTISEERANNPRILIKDRTAFVDHMNNLNLPNPKLMDVAVSANLACGEVAPPVTEH